MGGCARKQYMLHGFGVVHSDWCPLCARLRWSASLPWDLYCIENHPSTVESSSLKSYESGYAVTVERLLWVDGWEETTVDGEKAVHGQEMTLVVLKIVLASSDAKGKFARAEVAIEFEDPTAGSENEPTVVAWAPFRNSERWNASQAQRTKTEKKDGHASLGYSGVELSGGWSRESSVSWDQMSFDKGTAHARISLTTQRRNGVTWMLEHNKLQNSGVTPEFWATVLLSRLTAEPYLVKFRIDACAGSMEDFANKTRSFFGLDPCKTKPFLVTPWKSVVCNYEGKDIEKCASNTRLAVKWGPDHQIEVPMPSASRQAWGKEKMAKAEPKPETETEGLANNNNKAAEEDAMPTPVSMASPQKPALVPSFADTPAPAPAPAPAQVSQLSLPPLVVGWQSASPLSSTANGDSTRVTGLESRMAQLEARLAVQDVMIL
ncbi:hypothetical protein ACQKWADRAFT_329266 [Trichoderma austrokoningii]